MTEPYAGYPSVIGLTEKVAMPVITVRIGKGRPVETKRVAAQAITDAVVASLGVKREWVTILQGCSTLCALV